MRNFIYAVLLVLSPCVGFSQRTIKVSGTVNPARNGQKFGIIYGDFKHMVLDSARVKNGRVEFELKNADSTTVSLSTGSSIPMDILTIYVANADVHFEAKDSIRYAVVRGHKDSEDYQRIMGPINQISRRRFQTISKLTSIPASERNGEEAARISGALKVLATAEREAIFRAIDANPKTYVALMLLRDMAQGTISYDELMPHFQRLNRKLKITAEGKSLEEKIMLVKNLKSGTMARDFESLSPEGAVVRLSTIYPKSKYTFVDFWASWCIPCRAENPNVVKAYEAYGSKGLTILSVSLDKQADLWKAAIAKDGMPWLHASKLMGFDEPAAILYGIKMIPQNVLLDANGRIVASNLRGDALVSKLKQLMN